VAVRMNGHLCFTEPGEALVCGANAQASDHHDARHAFFSTSVAPPWDTWVLFLVKFKTKVVLFAGSATHCEAHHRKVRVDIHTHRPDTPNAALVTSKRRNHSFTITEQLPCQVGRYVCMSFILSDLYIYLVWLRFAS
jgi:hypothetical protein